MWIEVVGRWDRIRWSVAMIVTLCQVVLMIQNSLAQWIIVKSHQVDLHLGFEKFMYPEHSWWSDFNQTSCVCLNSIPIPGSSPYPFDHSSSSSSSCLIDDDRQEFPLCSQWSGSQGQSIRSGTSSFPIEYLVYLIAKHPLTILSYSLLLERCALHECAE